MSSLITKLLPNSWIPVLIFVITLFIILYLYFQQCFKYWSKLGIEVAVKPTFPVGNLGKLFLGKGTFGQTLADIYQKVQGPYSGIYFMHVPAILLKDPEYIKQILVKDFNYFVDRGIFVNIKRDPLNNHLFTLRGAEWRKLRAKLSPTFTSGKLKTMFPTLVECGTELQKVLQNITADSSAEIEVKDYAARYTTDIIASVAFGIKTNAIENPDSVFRQFGKARFNPNYVKSVAVGLRQCIPEIIQYLGLEFLHKHKEPLFVKSLTDTIEYREENKISRNDFLQLMIQLKNIGTVSADDIVSDLSEYDKVKNGNDCLSLDQVLAQAALFFIAGFETSSSTITLCLYELAVNVDIQDKVQQEIDEVLKKHGDEITYDSIMEMTYLDNVVAETLRKHSVFEFLSRRATADYKMPNSDLVIKKGTMVTVPLMALHNDPQYFPNPSKFDPDRFLPENKTWHPYSYLPFGEGPKNCIGARMGKMQTKIGVISVLRNFNLRVCEKTPIPMKISTRHVFTTSERDVVLKISQRRTANC